eukprot:426442_1
MPWLSFLIYLACINHTLVYACSDHHHTIVKGINLFEQFIPYKNHPYAKNTHSSSHTQSTERRSLLSPNEVSPIRIGAFYDTKTINKLPTTEQKYLKQLIGAVADYYRQTVSVVPINDAFYFDRQCAKGSVTNWGTACTSYLQPKCHGMHIPTDHLSEQYQYNHDGIVTILPRGRGIINTDLVLYVSANDNTASCKSTALAHAGPCTFDQYGRPISGNINLCSKFFSNNDWKQDIGIILHEMTHITIMLKSLWDAFKDYKGNTIPMNKVYDNSKAQLITSKVRYKAREHFNCHKIYGLPVQPSSTSHWHERYLFSETMTATTFSRQEYFSQFTLALMDDSGWYVINYEYAEPYHFGRNAGCDFFDGDCINKKTHKSNFPHYYCDSQLDDGCNVDYSAPSTCYYSTDLDNVPDNYRYFNDNHHGGFVNMNYCPSRTAYRSETTCWDIRGDVSRYQAETWGLKSRCADIHRIDDGNDKGYCFEHTCVGWNGRQWAQVDIKFSNTETIHCKRWDKLKRKTLQSVSNRQLTCPDIDIICGTNSKFAKCFYGHYSDVENKCTCSPGYKGSNCNIKNTILVSTVRNPVYKLPTPAPTYNPSTICFQDWNEYNSNFNGIWFQDNTFFNLKAYKRTFASGFTRQLFWNSIHASWWIAHERSTSASVYCYCSVSLYTPNIGDCNGNWKCYLNNGWKSIPNAKTYYG